MSDPQPVFRAIADPTRREIIGLLADRAMTVNEVSAQFDMTRPAVAKHLRVLSDGGLIEVERRGRERINRLRPEALMSVADWLERYSRFWDDKLEKLKKAVEEDLTMADGTMIKTIYLKAPRERVWVYLTDPEKLAQWFHETNRDLNERGSFEYYSYDPDRAERKLMWVMWWKPIARQSSCTPSQHEWLKGVVTTVTWELREVAGGTELTMIHDGIAASEDAFSELSGHDKGWDEHFLRLRLICN